MAVPHLLIVDDFDVVRRQVTRRFSQEGYRVTALATGSAALEFLKQNPVDVVVLDIGLPDIDGVRVCQEARHITEAPIIMLTGEASPDVAVRALDTGAVDYVRKPVDLHELAARVRAALRPTLTTRRRGPIEAGPLCIDEMQGQVAYSGRDIGASSSELKLLAFLAARVGEVISKAQLLEALWQDERDPHVIEVHVSNIRRKLRAAGCQQELIRTVHATGYRLIAP